MLIALWVKNVPQKELLEYIQRGIFGRMNYKCQKVLEDYNIRI